MKALATVGWQALAFVLVVALAMACGALIGLLARHGDGR